MRTRSIRVAGCRTRDAASPHRSRTNDTMSGRSTILWRRLDMPGHEIAELERAGEGWELRGLALLAHDGQPCRFEYRIECDAGWRTLGLSVHGQVGGRSLTLQLTRSAHGEWHADG